MVYRPTKKKTAGPASPLGRVSLDPLSGPLSRAADGEEIEGDERHLVTVDESYAGGDWEDRLWVFWRKQRGNIVRLVVTVVVALIIWQGWVAYQAHAAATEQADFQAANGTPALLAFAQAHPQSTLGKVAQLEAADALYKAANFKEAGDAYAQASTMWGADEKGQRARLGQAMCLIQTGDPKTGSAMLETLTNDSSAAENFRAESAYYLALLAIQAGDKTTAGKWIERIKEFKSSGDWINQTALLSEVAPLLGDVKVVKGYVPKAPTPTMAPTTPAETKSSVTSAPSTAPASAPAPAKDTGLLSVPSLPLLQK